MKKIILAILCIALYAGVAFAYADGTGVYDLPQTGLWKTHLSATQELGAKCQIGGQTYQYVYNNCGTQEFQGV